MLRRIDVLGYPILNESVEIVANEVCDGLDNLASRSFVFLNPHSVVIADRDPEFRNAINNASGIFCDGAGLSLACRMLTGKNVERIYGYEFFMALSRELSRRKQGRVFFLGGSTESLRELMAKYGADFPGIPAISSCSPPFRSAFSAADIDEMVRCIGEFKPDILWVGLGSPKQEIVLDRLMALYPTPCGAAIGAVFDFYTGRIPHAPVLVRRLGLQWLHRLFLEPTRLWRRTLISGPLFAARVFREFLVKA
jgi:N-acetylglucosaminyldiphosphoundecaprenol N-acetyl-beta-D-mannosaminyltransferase